MNNKYFNILLYFFVMFFRKSEGNQTDLERIKGGRPAKITEFPYQAEIETTNQQLICGAVIIHTQVLLSAAHCFVFERDAIEHFERIDEGYLALFIRARVGTNHASAGGQLLEVYRIVLHELYSVVKNDIALIFLRDKIKISKRATVIPLAKRNPEVGEIGYVTGYGKTSMRKHALKINWQGRLMAVKLQMTSWRECQKEIEANRWPNPKDQICAVAEAGKSGCVGDSGGPLAVNNYLVGIVSWGVLQESCKTPNGFTSIPYHYKWIKKHIHNFEKSWKW